METCPECGNAVAGLAACSRCGASWDDNVDRSARAAAETSSEDGGDAELAEILGSRYEVLARLGTGAIGEVYKARDTVLNRLVAVKRVRLAAFADEGQLELVKQRFLREAQLAAQLNHPNIVTIHDIVSAPTTSLIIMEFVDGTTLESLLESRTRLSLAETIEILSQVADALDHAHQHKVVHRDVKPANIMITEANEVSVTDFGIAKGETSSSLTAAGSLLGTPNYMSPEQARGGEVDGRSDLFSLGCVLYECLAGMRPFQSETLTDVLIRIVSDAPSPLNYEEMGLPAEVRAVLDRALAKDPARMFASGAELIDALRSITVASPDRVRPDVDGSNAPAPPPSDAGSEPPKKEMPARGSTVNRLLEDARKITEIEAYLKDMLREERLLSPASSAHHAFENVQLSPGEAFIFSLVDGKTRPREIIAASPLSEPDTARALLGFLRAELIVLEGADRAESKESLKRSSRKSPEKSPKKAAASSRKAAAEKSPPKTATLDEKTRRDIEQLLELCRGRDHWKVLDLNDGATRDEVKQAFQRKAFRYHPDRFGHIQEAGLVKKLSTIVNRLNEAYATLSKQAPLTRPAPPVESRAPVRPANQPRTEALPSVKDVVSQAKELFQRASNLYKSEKYWETIELCRYAIELDDGKADYYHLLGLALSRNPKWRYEAEENLLKATELKPRNATFLCALAEFYRREGMSFRAKRIFDKVRVIDPDAPCLSGG